MKDLEKLNALGEIPTVRVEDNSIEYGKVNKAIQKLENGEEATIVFFGDSNTDNYYGYTWVEGEEHSGVLNYPVEKHPEMLGALLKEKYGEDKVNIINSGVHGNNVIDLLERVQEDVLDHAPDLVVLNVGTNDSNTGWVEKNIPVSTFLTKLYELMPIILESETQPDVIIRSSNYNLSHYNSTYYYDNALRDIAFNYKVEYFGFGSKMQNDIESNLVMARNHGFDLTMGQPVLMSKELIQDGIHLTKAGQEYLTRKMYFLFKTDFTYKNVLLSEYVDNAYLVAYNRLPDESGKTHWYNLLNDYVINGRTFWLALIDTQEFAEKVHTDEHFIELCYRGVHCREYDELGFNHWLNVYRTVKADLGIVEARKFIIGEFTKSQEFKDTCEKMLVKP